MIPHSHSAFSDYILEHDEAAAAAECDVPLYSDQSRDDGQCPGVFRGVSDR